ncbi:MAG: branched-chain amino acid ABC transporter permease [Rhodospirillaceae bacterium]|nr:branched-chain amino acid ABC transporter permease [Rhodospirillaceae bacterium]
MNVNFWLDLLILTCIWAGVAGAWNLLAGFAGQFSLGHAAFFGIGAYVPPLMAQALGLPVWVGIVAGAALAAALALLIAGVSLRTRGPFFTLITIAFAEVVRILAVYFKGVTRGSEGLMLELEPGFANFFYLAKWPYLVLAALYAAGVIYFCAIVRRSRLGFRLLSVREDEDAARSLGVPVFMARANAAMLSAGLAAIGGSIFGLYTKFVDPDSSLSFLLSVEPALITIVGGLGQPAGPLLGAALVVPVEHRSAGSAAPCSVCRPGFRIALIVTLLLLPEGLVGGLKKWRGQRLAGHA